MANQDQTTLIIDDDQQQSIIIDDQRTKWVISQYFQDMEAPSSPDLNTSILEDDEMPSNYQLKNLLTSHQTETISCDEEIEVKDTTSLKNNKKRNFQSAKITEDDEEIVIIIKKRKLNPALLLSYNEDKEVDVSVLNQEHKLFPNIIRAFKEERIDLEDKLFNKLIKWSAHPDNIFNNEFSLVNEDDLIEYSEALEYDNLKISDFKNLVKDSDDDDGNFKMLFDEEIREILLKKNIITMDVSDY